MPARLPDHFWSSAALFLLPALSLVLPSGYSYAPALLIIVSLVNIRLWWGKVSLPKEVWWMYGSFALLALSWLVDGWLSGERGSALEKPLKILLTLPCLFYLAKRPPQARWLWHGAIVGAIGAAGISLYQITTQITSQPHGWPRAHGFTHPIQFGDLAILLGILSLSGLNATLSRTRFWRPLFFIGLLSGILASLLSSTRGGWLTLALIGLIVATHLLSKRKWKLLIPTLSLTIAIATISFHIPQLRLQERIAQIQSEITAFHTYGNSATSIGARLQMWEFAWNLYLQKPLLGWSQRGYQYQKEQMIAQQKLDPFIAELNHPHNEFLDTASKRGALGLLPLLLSYISPILLFYRTFKQTQNIEVKALSLAGMLIPVSYFGFGLTEAFLPHTSSITIYVYLITLIWATTKSPNHIHPKKKDRRSQI